MAISERRRQKPGHKRHDTRYMHLANQVPTQPKMTECKAINKKNNQSQAGQTHKKSSLHLKPQHYNLKKPKTFNVNTATLSTANQLNAKNPHFAPGMYMGPILYTLQRWRSHIKSKHLPHPASSKNSTYWNLTKNIEQIDLPKPATIPLYNITSNDEFTHWPITWLINKPLLFTPLSFPPLPPSKLNQKTFSTFLHLN